MSQVFRMDISGKIVPLTDDELAQREQDALRPPIVPQTIRRHQGLIALLLGPGITEQMIRDKIAEIEDPIQRELTRIRFEQAEWHLKSEFISWGADAFSLTSDQVEQLFIAAPTA